MRVRDALLERHLVRQEQRTAYHAIALSFMALYIEAGYAYAWSEPVRTEVIALVAAALLYNSVVALYAARSQRFPQPLVIVSTLFHAVVIAVGVAVTGGLQSLYLFLVPLHAVYTTIRVSPESSLRFNFTSGAIFASTLLLFGTVGPDSYIALAVWAGLYVLIDFALKSQSQTVFTYLQHAHRDPLTGLGNRRAIQRTIEDLVESRTPAASFTMVLLDLIDLRLINELHGHAGGDQVLNTIGTRLNDACGRDAHVVGRWGGDEFLIVLPPLGLTELRPFAQHLHGVLREPITLASGGVVRVGARIGFVTLDNPEDTAFVMSTLDDHLVNLSKAPTVVKTES